MNFLPFFKVFFCLSFILQIKLLTRTKFIHICILLFIATARHTKKLPWTRQFFLTLWSWSPSCADGHNQHAAHYRDIALSSSYLRLGQAQISDLLCGWWPAFLSETSWSYRTDHHFLLMGRPVKENSISYLKACLIQHGWILCDRGKIEGVFIYISMRLKRIRPHERKLRIRLSGKAKQRDRPDILSLTAWSSKHRCRSLDPIRNCQPTHRSVLSRHCHTDARRKDLRCFVLPSAQWPCSFQYPRSSRMRITS